MALCLMRAGLQKVWQEKTTEGLGGEGSKKDHEACGDTGGDFLLAEGNLPVLPVTTAGESLAELWDI